MATEGLCRHNNNVHTHFPPLPASGNAALKLNQRRHGSLGPTKLWHPRRAAGDYVRPLLRRAAMPQSSSISSTPPDTSMLTSSSSSSSDYSSSSSLPKSASSSSLSSRDAGDVLTLTSLSSSNSSLSSPSSTSKPASSLSSTSKPASSSSSTSSRRRSPPVFILNHKPDRSLPQPERQLERTKPKRRKENISEDDEGEPPAISTANHRSGYVALIGKPNVGKSTLMNQIIGQKLSIVTNKPQTTRHRILGICSAPDYQMVLYDTPGMIMKRMNKLDEMMMQNVRTAALNADCVLVIVDSAEAPQKVTDTLEEGALQIIQSRPSLLVLNKKDTIKPGEIAKKLQWYEQFSGINDVLAVSAKFGHGVSDLKEWLVSKLPLGPAYYPKENLSDQPEKFFASEIVREKIFLQYMKEIPYVSQVNVITYVERTPPAKDFIEIEIVVERDSQKGIMIGKEGSALKTLATAARLDIEDFVGREVYLEIKVKVKEGWRANESLLRYYGYCGQ